MSLFKPEHMGVEEIIEKLQEAVDLGDSPHRGPFCTFVRKEYLVEAIDLLRTRHGCWISVKDRLPETGEPVLIHNPNWDYGVVANYAGEGVWMDSWYKRMTYTPTHWIPLPESPKED